jgi:NAD-dependent dihydropyrimidine dehydrogenase PreA subunit
MIELVSEERCIECNICVSVCPTNVFDKTSGGIPVIARQSDCQTCFMCEVYCPADALYVAPEVDESLAFSEQVLGESGILGSYREQLGWGQGRKSTAKLDGSYEMYKAMYHKATD